MDYAGRRVVVTGAAGGIGAATVATILARGARCLLIDPDEAGLKALAATCPPGSVTTAVSSLDSPDACEAAIAGLDGPAYALVHMAGIYVPESAGPDPRAVYDRVLAANLTNAFDMAQTLMPRLDPADTCRMVFASSLAYRRGSRDYLAYSAAKGGIAGLVRALARRLAPGVLVNALAPGHIETAMPAHLWADSERAARLLADIPLGRRGRPEEVAGVIDFLLGDAAIYITGQVINVDGGIIGG